MTVPEAIISTGTQKHNASPSPPVTSFLYLAKLNRTVWTNGVLSQLFQKGFE